MDFALEKTEKQWTYSDYLKWDDGKRYELIDGEAYLMSPAPSTKHQRAAGAIYSALKQGLSKSKCDVFFAPFDVRFPDASDVEDEVLTVLQPDLVVICDQSKLDDRGCKGAPDLIVEILSPSSFHLDFKLKLSVYEKSGVKEYWIVDPINEAIFLFTLKNSIYQRPVVYGKDETFRSILFEEIEVNMHEVFE